MSKEFKATSVGGQAVIEGVMMRGNKEIATAVRCPDGHIEIEKKPLNLLSIKWKINKIPILRGVFSFFESMYTGVSCLMFSAKFFEDEEDSPEKMSKFEKWLQDKFGDKLLTIVMYISVLFSLIIGIGLFMLLPNFLAGLIKIPFPDISVVLLNIVESIVKMSIFLLYLYLVSQMEDIKRVFMYHGAEHKSIFCYEHGDELTVENVKKYSRFHPRCGTNLLVIVMIVSILVFSCISWGSLKYRIFYRLLLLPVVAGASYELIKIAGKYDNAFTKIISKPGVLLQHLTTKEPDDSQIEVALTALKAVISENRDEDKW
ncbi:MAG: DUF1385 domain-containing protein [Ruminococcaceae bacterium]|nr:DUF1385 domain-containing protein [Oscillospiraceae bacterium]